MTRSQLIECVADRLGIDRPAAEAVIHTIFGAMGEALRRGDGIELRGFGSFGVRRAAPYRARNPRSGATVEVKARRVPWFRVGMPLRLRVEHSGPRRPSDGVAEARSEAEPGRRPLAARRGAE